MKNLIYNSRIFNYLALSLILSLSSVSVTAKSLTKEEEDILKKIKQNQLSPISKKKDRFNKKVRVVRDDSKILRLPISVNDRVDLMICYNSPVVIKFDDSLKDEIVAVYSGNSKVYDVKKLPHNDKSVLVTLIEEPVEDGNFAVPLWVERKSDNRSYVFNLISEKCPTQGILPYPVEIIIQQKTGVVSKNQRLHIPSDLIYLIAKDNKRDNNRNFVRANGIMMTANSSFMGLSLSVIMKGLPKGKLLKDKNAISMKQPRFVFLDSLKVRTIESDTMYLRDPSIGETNINKLPTARFNIMLRLEKKYIFERKFVYVMIVFDDENYYHIAKIPLIDLYEDLRKNGLEV